MFKLILNTILKRKWLILMGIFFLVFFRYFLIRLPIVQEITPDSKLYFGLAKNLTIGKGYNDTIRNDEILPPIGHPLLLSFFILFKLTLYFDKFLICLSFLFIGLAVWKYTNNMLFVVLSCYFMFLILNQIGFYKFGIETSGFFTSCVLVYFLTCLFKNKFSLLDVSLTSVSLAINILVRPTLLYIVIFITLFLVLYVIWMIKKGQLNKTLFQFKLFLTFLAALFLILGVYTYSIYTYKDERLVRGTFAAMNFYLSNNAYLPSNLMYNTSYFYKYIPIKDQNLVLLNPTGWKDRETALFAKGLDYIRHNPVKAFKGWLWRLDKYLGSDYHLGGQLYIYKILIRLILFLLIMEIILYFVFFRLDFGKIINFLGPMVTLLLAFQIFQLMFFSWSGKRYLIYLVPYLISALFFLLQDCISLMKKKKIKFTRGL